MRRDDFPLLRGSDIAYLDSAATTQKPEAVLAEMDRYYRESNANVHRSIYPLADRATGLFEGARGEVAVTLGAGVDEVVFVRNATEALNLVAWGWARPRLGPGDRVVTTVAEHHANLVPWQRVCAETGAELAVLDVAPDGALDPVEVDAALGDGGRVLAVHHLSNVLGRVQPVARLVEMAHAHGAVAVVDGAQAVGHLPVDFAALGADFYAFSGHKAYGPTGIGVLLGRRERLGEMEPMVTGGEMVAEVTRSGARFVEPPHRFEAGTPPIAEAVGLAAALRYLRSVGMGALVEHERLLVERTLRRLGGIPGVRVLGPGLRDRAGLVSFVLAGVHPTDLAALAGGNGVAVRAGHHCAQPLHGHLGMTGSCRASFGLYSVASDVDRLAEQLELAQGIFGRVPSRLAGGLSRQ
jgi:cysteine desulfurase/selenocysteine lyase